jgi:hypothetical protein
LKIFTCIDDKSGLEVLINIDDISVIHPLNSGDYAVYFRGGEWVAISREGGERLIREIKGGTA